ncbi:hypothetical protein B9Z55_013589 [Caenorhabditis nigoni]|uniref:PAN-3 domain-containing protein n=1 Tax=Caenorhabditis nigoni TaxID=1611254 RepID=A0A2G5U2F2_9PELO|nr:hypothetical protein B9Z55_013589 [Caenorhabditis nigoni]
MRSLLNFLCVAVCIYGFVGQEKPQMMLFQGSVNSTDQCIRTNITNTTFCTISCATNESCLLTVMKPSQCIHCNYGMVSSLTRGPSDTYISLKISDEFQYLIQDSPSFSWYFSIDISHLTELIIVNDVPLNQTEGQKLCKKEGDVLSGLETKDEHSFVNASAHGLMNSLQDSETPGWGVWISGTKKDECEKKNTTEPGPCEKMDGFDFEDKTLQEKNGYIWDQKEPNNLEFKQHCIYMMIGGKYVNRKGTLDDISCEPHSPFSLRAALCGKEAR